MTDIEQKALALVNEVRTDRGFGLITWFDREEDIDDIDREALCRAIEQHEAFRQEVSDVVVSFRNEWLQATPSRQWFQAKFGSFIIAKPDPLVEAWNDMFPRGDCGNCVDAEVLRAAIEKRGGKIVWGEG